MPTNPTASPNVSSTIGLKNVVIAPLLTDTETGHTYGDLQLVAGAIEANRGVKLERGQLNLPDQLKEVGSYDAKIDLGEGVFAPFKVQIVEEAAE